MATEPAGPFRVLGTVAAVAAFAALTVTGSYELSRERIAANERQRQLASLQDAAGIDAAGTPPEAISIPLSDGDATGPSRLFALFADGAQEPILVFATAAPDGYNGAINLLVGIAPGGVLTGVRVVSHRETPGLGDAIERSKSDWVDQFVGASLERPQVWAVDKDGGAFDSLTGATVTPRAVIRALHAVLEYYNRNAQQLLEEAMLIRGTSHD
jgi:electron transport complex protein RnfG